MFQPSVPVADGIFFAKTICDINLERNLKLQAANVFVEESVKIIIKLTKKYHDK